MFSILNVDYVLEKLYRAVCRKVEMVALECSHYHRDSITSRISPVRPVLHVNTQCGVSTLDFSAKPMAGSKGGEIGKIWWKTKSRSQRQIHAAITQQTWGIEEY